MEETNENTHIFHSIEDALGGFLSLLELRLEAGGWQIAAYTQACVYRPVEVASETAAKIFRALQEYLRRGKRIIIDSLTQDVVVC